jgi:DNA-binding response OmpR family regulator
MTTRGCAKSLFSRYLLNGYPVQDAADGSEALKMIETSHPSLVVLDMPMPILDGWGLSRELKAKSLDPPVLAMTAAPDPARSAHEIGAADFLQKPFGIADLLAKVEALRIA